MILLFGVYVKIFLFSEEAVQQTLKMSSVLRFSSTITAFSAKWKKNKFSFCAVLHINDNNLQF